MKEANTHSSLMEKEKAFRQLTEGLSNVTLHFLERGNYNKLLLASFIFFYFFESIFHNKINKQCRK